MKLKNFIVSLLTVVMLVCNVGVVDVHAEEGILEENVVLDADNNSDVAASEQEAVTNDNENNIVVPDGKDHPVEIVFVEFGALDGIGSLPESVLSLAPQDVT